jgi:YidC/Oxa1 family membrane protein insertase
MSDQKNLILAVVLSVVILMMWDFMYRQPAVNELAPPTQTATGRAAHDSQSTASQAPAVSNGATGPVAPGQNAIAPITPGIVPALDNSPRLKIEAERIHGSVRLRGARIDDLILNDYRNSLEGDSENIILLSTAGTQFSYYAEFGWAVGAGIDAPVPDSTTLWQASGDVLVPGAPITLEWDNGQGLLFQRTISVDENYMLSITQHVSNTSTFPVTLHPYGLISRSNPPDTLGFFILHEGPIAVLNDELQEIDYDDLQDDGRQTIRSTGGWLGITDKYWLTAMIPDQSEAVETSFNHVPADEGDRYQVDFLGGPRVVPAGGAVAVTNRMFAGAKEVHLLDQYTKSHNVPRFDLAVDFGWFYFLTKPIFFIIDYLNRGLGNFGLAILVFTVLIRILFYPLASKSFRAMHAMRRLQPEMTKMREQFADDRTKLHQSMMELYKREKVNPMAGCLPIAMQIPVFFALYKVLFVTIEMRHAPFYGWIQDLSAADPTSIFNLFGLIPWDPPVFLAIGIWPLLMGVSMFMQQKINPQPVDPMQAKIFLALPIVFTFVLAQFPAGLVIYWTWNNLLSMAQQWMIYKRAGITRQSVQPTKTT